MSDLADQPGAEVLPNGMTAGPVQALAVEETPEEATLRRHMALIRLQLGAPPAPPSYRDFVAQAVDVLGEFMGRPEGAVLGPAESSDAIDRANALLSADYHAALSTYNERFKLLLAALQCGDKARAVAKENEACAQIAADRAWGAADAIRARMKR